MAITVVQTAPTVNLASLTGPVTATFARATTAGNTLVACVTTNGDTANPAVSGITLGGAAGNWRAAHTDPGTVQYGGAIWYDPGCAGGQTAVAVTCSGGSGTNPNIYVTVYEVAGVLLTDVGSHNDNHTTGTTWTSNATATTAVAGEIFFGVATASSGVPTVTGAGSWTTQQLTTGGLNQIAGFQIVAATGTATFSGTIASGVYSALAATFFPSVLVRSSSTYASAATEASFTMPLPSGFAAGDVCYIFAEDRAATGSLGIAPAGWVTAAATFNSGSSTSSEMAVYRKVMTGAEANPVVTGTSGRFSAVCVAVTGADNATPEDVVAVEDGNGASASSTITSPGITPAAGSDLLLIGFGCGTPVAAQTIAFSTPAGMTLAASVSTVVAALTESGMMVASLALSSSSATGTKATTITGGTVNGQTVTIAVRPAGTLPAAPATQALPGKTWLRRFWHRQQLQAAAPMGAVTIIATATIAGAGAVADVPVTQACTATAPGAGAVAALVTEIPATTTAAGAATVAAKVTQIAPASLAGAGSVTDVVTQAVTASPAGAGAVTDVVTEIVTATIAGAGVVGPAPVTQIVTATLAGAGAVNATATTPGGASTATIAGAGAVAAVVTQGVIAAPAGAGSLTAAVTEAVTASPAGAGAVTANVVQAATANAVGAGAVSAVAAQAAKATLAGAGAVTASGQITGTANLAAAGSLTAKTVQAAVSTPAAAGAVSAAAGLSVPAVLAAAGAVTAVSGTAIAFTAGALSASTAPTATQAPADKATSAATASVGPSSAITATDQRTGGPG